MWNAVEKNLFLPLIIQFFPHIIIYYKNNDLQAHLKIPLG